MVQIEAQIDDKAVLCALLEATYSGNNTADVFYLLALINVKICRFWTH